MKTFEKPLSAQEEKELLIKLREGDSVARNALIEKNMRLVAHIVKKYTSTERDYINEDLISVGTIGGFRECKRKIYTISEFKSCI